MTLCADKRFYESRTSSTLVALARRQCQRHTYLDMTCKLLIRRADHPVSTLTHTPIPTPTLGSQTKLQRSTERNAQLYISHASRCRNVVTPHDWMPHDKQSHSEGNSVVHKEMQDKLNLVVRVAKKIWPSDA